MPLPTLDDADFKSKTVLVRVDFNVPIENGVVSDITRLEASAETILELRQQGAKVVLISHMGRPGGEVDETLSLKQVVQPLSDMLGHDVLFCEETVGSKAKQAVQALNPGQILLLENLRFHKGEKSNSDEFSDSLAELADFYVNDAFSAAHRSHASTSGIADRLPSYAGRHLEQEVKALDLALENPKRPLAAIVGGAKISTKLGLIENMVDKTDSLILGGGMANTFLLAQGKAVGNSLAEEDMVNQAKAIMAKAEYEGCEIILPDSVIVAKELKEGVKTREIICEEITEDEAIFDIGNSSCEKIEGVLKDSSTLLWNGPLGVFEVSPFDEATKRIARYAAQLVKDEQLTVIAGGGDTVSALNKADVTGVFNHVSTAGGAFLESIEGKELPAISKLYEAQQRQSGCCGGGCGGDC